MAKPRRTLPGHDHPAAMSILSAPRAAFTKTMRLNPDGTSEKTGEADNRSGFNYHAFGVRTFDELKTTITELAAIPNALVVRAAVVENPPGPEPGLIYRRLASSHASTGTLVEVARNWMCVDVDATSFVVPDGWMNDPEAMVEGAIRYHLPEQFWEAGCVVQFSSRMSPNGGDFRAHLWFLLSRPTSSEELLWWLDPQIGMGLIDPAPLRPNQQILTATPLWRDASGKEVADPLGEHRVISIDGPPVAVPDAITPPRRTQPARSSMSKAQRAEWDGKPLKEKLQPFLEAIGICGLHPSLVTLTWEYARLTKYQPRDREWLRELARPYVVALPRSAEDIENRLGADFNRHYEGACAQVDEKLDRVHGDILSPQDVAEIDRQEAERRIEAKTYDKGYLTRALQEISRSKEPQTFATDTGRQVSM